MDIAKASGVSKATVSLVLMNSPSIPERTREKVLEAAKGLGYVYNRGGRKPSPAPYADDRTGGQ